MEFFNFMSSIFGENVLRNLKYNYIVNYFDILRKLEKIKRDVFTVSAHPKPHVYFEYPRSLEDLYKKEFGNTTLEDAVMKSNYNKLVAVKDGRLCISKSIIENMFTKLVQYVVNNINRVLNDLDYDKVNTFIVVGGFTLSPILKKELSKSFKNVDIIISEDSDMIVAKGAILSTHKPNIIVSRISQYTYGRLVQPLYDEEKHHPTKLLIVDGSSHCNEIFEVLVKKGERMEAGKSIRRDYDICDKRQKSIKFEVFATKEDTIRYTDDLGCKPFCIVDIDLPITSTSDKRYIAVYFEFGNTEFKVTAFEKETNNLCKVTCSF